MYYDKVKNRYYEVDKQGNPVYAYQNPNYEPEEVVLPTPSQEELELLRESGFHPMEVIRAATLHAAEAIGMEDKIGSVEVGKLADLIIMDQNPLKNLKYL